MVFTGDQKSLPIIFKLERMLCAIGIKLFFIMLAMVFMINTSVYSGSLDSWSGARKALATLYYLLTTKELDRVSKDLPVDIKKSIGEANRLNMLYRTKSQFLGLDKVDGKITAEDKEKLSSIREIIKNTLYGDLKTQSDIINEFNDFLENIISAEKDIEKSKRKVADNNHFKVNEGVDEVDEKDDAGKEEADVGKKIVLSEGEMGGVSQLFLRSIEMNDAVNNLHKSVSAVAKDTQARLHGSKGKLNFTASECVEGLRTDALRRVHQDTEKYQVAIDTCLKHFDVFKKHFDK